MQTVQKIVYVNYAQLAYQPVIAQLVERRTVVVSAVILRSAVRLRLAGRLYFFKIFYIIYTNISNDINFPHTGYVKCIATKGISRFLSYD